MRALERKLLRDVIHLRGQLMAVALVVMCGVAMWVTMRGAYRSLVLSQQAYYAADRFADVFARLVRAPLPVARAIEQIPGVTIVQTRIVFDVTLDVRGLSEPATGRLVSIPENGRPQLNDVHLRQGRWIDSGNPGEVIVSEAFAMANQLHPGDSVGAILNGRWRRLLIVGIGLSPEYVYEIRVGDVFPDKRRFGILWIGRKAIQNAFSMEGAFNDIALALAPGTHPAEVIRRMDDLLAQYGGTGAYDREQQISHRFLADEISGDRVAGTIVPAIFLGVAAFLIHIVLSRLVQTQRDQIAVLKAFGYSNLDVGLHYLGISLVAVGLGSILGILVGGRLMISLSTLYKEFFHFPIFRLDLSPSLLAGGVIISALAASLGAIFAVAGAVRLPPAEAMRPESPPRFHAGLIERTNLFRSASPATRIVLRNMLRRKIKAALSILGVALAVAILVVAHFMFDSVDALMALQFHQAEREDVTVPFLLPRSGSAVSDLRRMRGVLTVESYRAVSVKIAHGNRERRTGLFGLHGNASLRRLVDRHGNAVQIPPGGIVINRKLAEVLAVREGDRVTLHVFEGIRPVVDLPVTRIIDDLLGLGAYADIDVVRRLLDESDVVSGAYLAVDPLAREELFAQLKQAPAVAGVSIREAMIQSFKETIAQSLAITNTAGILFACIIAAGVIYNGARIALSERGRELASLRVLGFTRGEVGWMLIAEQAILTAMAIPLGFGLGYGLAALLVRAYDSEVYRLPLVISRETWAFAFIVVAVAAVASSLLVLRRIRHLDLVEVLKTRE
jgi:putative ABC transport system permease protein